MNKKLMSKDKAIFILFLAIGIVLSFPLQGSAQDEPRHAGREFRFVLPQNDKGLYDSTSGIREVAMYIAAEGMQGSRGFVEYALGTGRQRDTFNIRSGEVLKVSLPPEAELEYKAEPQKKEINVQVETGDPVVVYVLSGVPFTSDAMLVPPITALDSSYIALSHRSNFSRGRYSFIAVSALENGTEIRLTSASILRNPNNETNLRPNEELVLLLDSGESRIVLGGILRQSDLSGTLIKGNKPFFACSGHERAVVDRGPRDGTSADYLLTQLPPISQLGITAIMNTFRYQDRNIPALGRIVAAFDSTIVTLADTTIMLAKAGDKYEQDITEAVFFRCNKPALFGQLAYSESVVGGIGDPLLCVIPPVEQYLQKYTFIVPAPNNFDEHYITITIEEGFEQTIRMDGMPLVWVQNVPVPGSSYRSITARMQPGVHRIEASVPLGILCFGLRQFDSYGYTGGTATRRLVEKILDKEPPERVTVQGDCEVTVAWQEPTRFASGIAQIEILDSVNVEVVSEYQLRNEAAFTFLLRNPFQDGFVTLLLRDSAGNRNIDTIIVAGFTISVSTSTVVAQQEASFFCDTLQIRNVGLFTQFFSVLLNNNDDISVPPSFYRVEIPPGESAFIPVCYGSAKGNQALDTISLLGSCNRIQHIPVSMQGYKNQELTGNTRCNAPIRVGQKSRLLKQVQPSMIDILPSCSLILFDITGREVFRSSGTVPNWNCAVPTYVHGVLLYKLYEEQNGTLLETGTLFIE